MNWCFVYGWYILNKLNVSYASMIIYNKISAFIIIQLNNQLVKGAFKSFTSKNSTFMSFSFNKLFLKKPNPTQPKQRSP